MEGVPRGVSKNLSKKKYSTAIVGSESQKKN